MIPHFADDSQAYVMASDDSRARLAAFNVDKANDRFALVFAPATSAHSFQLHWPDNPPINLGR